MKILDRLPFFRQERTVYLPMEPDRQTIQPLMVVVQVSLSIRNRIFGPIPAFLDSGFNHNFLISRSQFVSWIGMEPDAIEATGRMSFRGEQIILRKVDVLIHRNERGTNTIIPDDPFPWHIDQDRGIAIQNENANKLPILGMRSIVRNYLRYIIDGKNDFVTLRSSHSWE